VKTKEEILKEYDEGLVKLADARDKALEEMVHLTAFKAVTGMDADFRYYGKCPGFEMKKVTVEELQKLLSLFPPAVPVEIDHKKKYEVSHKICLRTHTHMSHFIKEDTMSFYWMTDEELHIDVSIPLADLPCLDGFWIKSQRRVTDIEFDSKDMKTVSVSWQHGDEFVDQPTIDEVIKLITEQALQNA